MFANQFFFVTSFGDGVPTIIHKDKVVVIFPIPLAEQLANGKTSVILVNGMRVNCTETFQELKDLLIPRAN